MEELVVITSYDHCRICWNMDKDEELVKAIRKLRWNRNIDVNKTVEEFIEKTYHISMKTVISTVKDYLLEL